MGKPDAYVRYSQACKFNTDSSVLVYMALVCLKLSLHSSFESTKEVSGYFFPRASLHVHPLRHRGQGQPAVRLLFGEGNSQGQWPEGKTINAASEAPSRRSSARLDGPEISLHFWFSPFLEIRRTKLLVTLATCPRLSQDCVGKWSCWSTCSSSVVQFYCQYMIKGPFLD